MRDVVYMMQSQEDLYLEKLRPPHVEEEVRKKSKAGRPLKAGRIIFLEVAKLASYPYENAVQPSQYIKHLFLFTPDIDFQLSVH